MTGGLLDLTELSFAELAALAPNGADDVLSESIRRATRTGVVAGATDEDDTSAFNSALPASSFQSAT